MHIADLRTIGKSLFHEITVFRCTAGNNISLGIGAAGDQTFTIDKKAEDIIISGIKDLGEPVTLISEEAGIMDLHGGGKRVIIDPIDGSKNAVSGIPFFSSSIAVADGDTVNDIYLAYIMNLITGDEFWAERGAGAFLNGSRMSGQNDDILALVAYEAQAPAKDIVRIMPLLAQARKTRCFGSTALDLAYLSQGAASVFVCPSPSRSFDFAGGWLLVKESGGIITDIEGVEISHLKLGIKRNSPLLASGNPQLHEKALCLLSQGKPNV